MINLKHLIAAATFTVFAFGSTTVLAQTNPAGAAAPSVQQQQQTVSDTELRQFIQASIEVAKVREDYTKRISNAKDQPIAQQLQQDAQDKIVGAVEALGLDAMSYNRLAEQVQSSPELQQRIQELQ